MESGSANKHIQLSLENTEQLAKVCHALSTDLRLRIICHLRKQSMQVNELAEVMNQPASTIALNVRILGDAGLITTEIRHGSRGYIKLCSRSVDDLKITLFDPMHMPSVTNEISIPVAIGSYSDCQVERTCGMVNENCFIGSEDSPESFYMPDHITAQHLWFRNGYLEYRFPLMNTKDVLLTHISCSMEICSEAPYYRNEWPSDITLWINDIELGTWRSPGDFGGRRGQFCPAWWPDTATQFGLLKTWYIDRTGTYLDSLPFGKATIDQLALRSKPYVSLRIGIKKNAECIGGISLFGEKFGDYNQPILIRLGYEFPKGNI